jgi:hypothetical protein
MYVLRASVYGTIHLGQYGYLLYKGTLILPQMDSESPEVKKEHNEPHQYFWGFIHMAIDFDCEVSQINPQHAE